MIWPAMHIPVIPCTLPLGTPVSYKLVTGNQYAYTVLRYQNKSLIEEGFLISELSAGIWLECANQYSSAVYTYKLIKRCVYLGCHKSSCKKGR